jgi:hypothetical protein
MFCNQNSCCEELEDIHYLSAHEVREGEPIERLSEVEPELTKARLRGRRTKTRNVELDYEHLLIDE